IKDLLNNIKYSYECFKSYIDLLNTFVDRIEDTQRPKTISFQKIKVHTADNKFFTLSGPGNFISTDIENSKDLKVTLIFKDGRREIIDIESVSKKEQDLLIFCPNCISANIIAEFSNVFKIEFRFYPILDLLERLKNFFGNTDYINTWDNIQKSLPKLNYIYGPPGTGKTTTLSAKINQIITDKKDVKIIILTPTNKAADVIMKKIYEFEKENSYIYARRFSRPTDPDLKDEIYVEIIDNNVNVIISTIHKLLYLNNNNEQLLQQNWDYVIFDESSMIDLQYIVFAIMAFYKRNKNTIYYVAGDPKQIPPVNNIDDNEYEDFDLQDENIYKMMGLDSFAENKQNIREHDTIQNLTTQYRSIPQIGELFSKISYSGLLKHGRTTNETNPKKLPDGFLNNLILSNISFINIP
ncbi:MAG: AAA family ATPase, partial [Sediminibacterium sp.]|nr:AAA family ATPase [Sediminibacterium sp.]